MKKFEKCGNCIWTRFTFLNSLELDKWLGKLNTFSQSNSYVYMVIYSPINNLFLQSGYIFILNHIKMSTFYCFVLSFVFSVLISLSNIPEPKIPTFSDSIYWYIGHSKPSNSHPIVSEPYSEQLSRQITSAGAFYLLAGHSKIFHLRARQFRRIRELVQSIPLVRLTISGASWLHCDGGLSPCLSLCRLKEERPGPQMETS